MRGLVSYLVLGDVTPALLWVETASNVADYPSRFMPLPCPRSGQSGPRWLADFGVERRGRPGFEVFAGCARMTDAHLAQGVPMLPPVEIKLGKDAFDPEIDATIFDQRIAFIWLAPPCSSFFSLLRNLDKGGPLRPPGWPEGIPGDPRVEAGNRLWARALDLAWKAVRKGILFMIEHPAASRAWALASKQDLINHDGVQLLRVDFCAYDDEGREDLPNRKPTRIRLLRGSLVPYRSALETILLQNR